MSIAHSLPKGGTPHFNLSTQSLDMVISTFKEQARGTQQAPILGVWDTKSVGSIPHDSSFVYEAATPSTGLKAAAAGEYGTYTKSFTFGLTVGWPKLLNNSEHHIRNGYRIQQCTHIVKNFCLILKLYQKNSVGFYKLGIIKMIRWIISRNCITCTLSISILCTYIIPQCY